VLDFLVFQCIKIVVIGRKCLNLDLYNIFLCVLVFIIKFSSEDFFVEVVDLKDFKQ